MELLVGTALLDCLRPKQAMHRSDSPNFALKGETVRAAYANTKNGKKGGKIRKWPLPGQ
jgi:hypothetical protein